MWPSLLAQAFQHVVAVHVVHLACGATLGQQVVDEGLHRAHHQGDGASRISTTAKRAPGRPARRLGRPGLRRLHRWRMAFGAGHVGAAQPAPKACASASRRSTFTPNSRRWMGSKTSAGSWMFSTSTSA
jgi:hypothetical protein